MVSYTSMLSDSQFETRKEIMKKQGFSGAAIMLFLLLGLIVGSAGGAVAMYAYLEQEIASLKLQLEYPELREEPPTEQPDEEITWKDVQEQNEQLLDMAEKLKED